MFHIKFRLAYIYLSISFILETLEKIKFLTLTNWCASEFKKYGYHQTFGSSDCGLVQVISHSRVLVLGMYMG